MIQLQDDPPIFLLDNSEDFPDPAWPGMDELVAVGGDFSPTRIIEAYRMGIFPWFMEKGVIYWFSPDPRMVLFPERVKISKSLAKTLRKETFEIRFDTAFSQVMEGCASVRRRDQEGTWIEAPFIEGYTRLFEMGVATSVEAWRDGRLVGGLYGLKMGNVFFGESMFALETDASKVALVTLSRQLQAQGYAFIDCQVPSFHLRSMGGEEIDRDKYLKLLNRALDNK